MCKTKSLIVFIFFRNIISTYERLNDEAFTIVRRNDIPEKNKYDEAFGLAHSLGDKAPQNKNKNEEKRTPKENSKSKIKHPPSPLKTGDIFGNFHHLWKTHGEILRS